MFNLQKMVAVYIKLKFFKYLNVLYWYEFKQ